MENQSKNESFNFTYSAKEQDEINKIRQRYMPKEETKMDYLRRLDQGVTRKSTMISIGVGVIGSLVLGIGMCCTLVWKSVWFVPGILIGVLGIGIVSGAYPIYTYVTKKERQRIAPEIMRITDELMK